MTKEKAKKKIKELVKDYEGIKKRGEVGLYKEETTKQRFIQPLFKALGWDFKVDVWPEEKVSKGRVDYAFKLNNITKFFVETKSLKIGLDNPDYDKQVINYGWLKDITWVVLTNFEELKIFNSELKEENLVLDLTYDRYLKDFDDLWRLSKEAFIKGELDRWAEKYGKKAKRLKVGEQLFEDLLQWRKFLSDNVYQLLGLSKEEISEGVQRILDRLIFIRTAEDRGIEEKILLPKLREWEDKGRKQEFMEVLSKVFRDFDEGYNSELFDHHDCEKWGLGTEVLEKVVKGLYKTKDGLDYDFSAIGSDVLGGIYEQYLGHLLETIKGETKVISGRAKRKEKGIYYTPKFIVDYIVKNTLGEVLKNKKPNEIRKLKVLDPACGSGSFLQRAHQEIVDYLEEKKSEIKDEKSKLGAIAKLIKEKEGKKELSVAQKIEILRNNIYGVDLDHQAVEIARLNLLLKVLKKRQRLPLLDDTIKEGNSLISGDEKELKKYFGDKWKEKKPFNWKEEFEEVFRQEGFDVIIGNPPYVGSLEISKTSSKGEKDYLKEKYRSARGVYDLYVVFLEKSIRLLKEKGLLGFIVPNKFMSTDYGFHLRKYILEKCSIREIIDVSSLSVFKGVAVYPIILILQKEKRKKYRDRNQLLFNELENINKLDFKEGRLVHQSIFTRNNKYVFSSFISEGMIGLIKKFEKHTIPLCKVSDVSSGTTGFDYSRYGKLITEQKPEKEYRKFIITRNIEPYYISWGKRINYLKRSFIHPYLAYSKKIISKGKWDLFKDKKITIRGLSKRLTAAADNEGFALGVGVYALRNLKINKKFLLALLNSKVLDYYYRVKFSSKHLAGGYLGFNVGQLSQLPIYRIDLSKKSDKEKHDKLLRLVNKILELNKELQKFGDKITDKRKKIEKEIERTDRKIDGVVYKLYGLTRKEIKIVEN